MSEKFGRTEEDICAKSYRTLEHPVLDCDGGLTIAAKQSGSISGLALDEATCEGGHLDGSAGNSHDFFVCFKSIRAAFLQRGGQ